MATLFLCKQEITVSSHDPGNSTVVQIMVKRSNKAEKILLAVEYFRIYFINPLTFIIFLLTYDFLKFIFIRNIFIDLVVIRGEYMGKVFRVFNFWLKCYWSRRKMFFKVRCKSQKQSEVFRFVQRSMGLAQTKFFFYISSLTSHVNSIRFILKILIF